VDVAALARALGTRTRITPDGPITSPLDARASAGNRDALVKVIYARVFDWLVGRINSSIGQDPAAAASIGLLDIYGFESFQFNDLEQFCINLANEKLQQHFNQHVFKWEQVCIWCVCAGRGNSLHLSVNAAVLAAAVQQSLSLHELCSRRQFARTTTVSMACLYERKQLVSQVYWASHARHLVQGLEAHRGSLRQCCAPCPSVFSQMHPCAGRPEGATTSQPWLILVT
jgi:hypothetical protein